MLHLFSLVFRSLHLIVAYVANVTAISDSKSKYTYLLYLLLLIYTFYIVYYLI
jgi:hypothetical protein